PARQLPPQQAEVLMRYAQKLNEPHPVASSPAIAEMERRRAARHACHHFVLVTPCVSPEQPLLDQTARVAVKDISSGGISFVQTGSFLWSGLLVTFRVRGVQPIWLLGQVTRVAPMRLGL